MHVATAARPCIVQLRFTRMFHRSIIRLTMLCTACLRVMLHPVAILSIDWSCELWLG